MKGYELRRLLRYGRALFVSFFFAEGDSNILNLLKEQIAKKYLDRKYVKEYYLKKKVEEASSETVPHNCWIYWKQGIKNAPPIVKKCVETTVNLFEKNEWTVHVMDYEDARELTDIPLEIWEKNENGLIIDAHMSDLIRVSLLDLYGGIWVDATVFFSDKKTIPTYLYDTPFFVFSNYQKNDNYINFSAWLIASGKENVLIKDTKNILYMYWKKENVAIQYYMFHLIFKSVTERNQESWNNVHLYSNVPPHIMQKELFCQYSEQRFKELCQMTSIHKLTWRVPDTIREDSLYLHIINE